MGTYDRVFVKEVGNAGHAERTRIAIEQSKINVVKLDFEFAAINIQQALTIIENKK